MKKFLSVALSAAISLTGFTAFSGTHTDMTAEASDGTDIVIFGDSISSGYGRNGNVKYNYGDICADYLGGSVNNYAVTGHKTDDLIQVIDSLDDNAKQNVSEADYIIISIGGNDMLQSVCSIMP